ncbi:MAG: ketoacyl-ACP synthase III, partial [Salinisphaera sp.]|nr:ketoacyl-ACP synthase III [Salinisphaera sp.]
MHAAIQAISYLLPARSETSAELARAHPDWSMEKLVQRTGVRIRHVAADDECASDLAVDAARRLFTDHSFAPDDFDFLLFCTQTPDYLIPTTACLVQERLGMPKSVGAMDMNLGCSGYIYGLGVAKGLIETGQARRVLLLTADTYSKFVHPRDRSVRALFGDAAAATSVVATDDEEPAIGPFVYGTDGSGAEDLIVPMSGLRQRFGNAPPPEVTDRFGNVRSARHVHMNGKGVIDFTLREVPAAVHTLCERAGLALDDFDAIVPHQASAKVLEGLRRRLKLGEDRFVVYMRDIGNTV